jgi:cytochrome oxidase Cu insertion factor (SCO1/SenC/PrrC family)
MNSGLSDTNPILVAAFRAALLHQGLILLILLTALAVTWLAAREFARRAPGSWPGSRARGAAAPEPPGRRLLRIGFGVIWIFDGLMQAQPAMAAGLPGQVVRPAAATSPAWVQHLVNWAGTTWSFHPVQAGAAAVWIQVGIGAWLIAAPSGWPSRVAALAASGWGLVVWVFGEAFGGILAPGLTFLFGAPGAVLFYCVAGVLVALPPERWTRGLGRAMLAVLGVFLAGMAVLQAWPGRGFWQGELHGHEGSLATMASSMASVPQPRPLAALVRWFAAADVAHGFAVNLVAVLALALIAAALIATGMGLGRSWLGRSWLARPALLLLLAFCLADWVLVEDLGVFGGLGTDPNSMIPVALLAVAGYLALMPPASRPAVQVAQPDLAGRAGAAGARAVLIAWAVVVVLVGAAPLAVAQASPHADVIIARAIDGNAAPLNLVAPAFTLTDQAGHQVSLASLRGKVVLLTFLDPVCTSDCPLIAQEFRAADRLLRGRSRQVELVAIVANPVYRTLAYTRAFDRQEGLAGVRNWLYLTGSLARLRQAWKDYGVAAEILPAGGMIAHNDVAYVIDPTGHTRNELDFDPGPGTASSTSSFAVELADAAGRYLGRP